VKRRTFLKSASGGLAVIATSAPGRAAHAAAHDRPRLIPCINQATTRKADFKTSMEAYRKAGFSLVELWLDSVQPFLKSENVSVARRLMSDQGLEPRSACCECEPLFFRGLQNPDEKWADFKRKLDLASSLGANRFVLCSGVSEEVKPSDYDAAVPNLHEIGELGKQFDIVIGVEFIRGAKFVGCVETAANLVRKTGHPNLRVLVDTFHFYAGISKLTDIEKLNTGDISWIHVNDVPAMPRELLQDTDRVYVGQGVMPLEAIMRTLAKVYEGPVSFEAFRYADDDPFTVAKESFDGLSRLLARV
jgi:2-keto-myo-inositol isomerase